MYKADNWHLLDAALLGGLQTAVSAGDAAAGIEVDGRLPAQLTDVALDRCFRLRVKDTGVLGVLLQASNPDLASLEPFPKLTEHRLLENMRPIS